ncbi:MAG: hypothetical protein KC609_19060 [Myxococcales bacterium]|nr:hypothetical protein [Myxococcales bacterium]
MYRPLVLLTLLLITATAFGEDVIDPKRGDTSVVSQKNPLTDRSPKGREGGDAVTKRIERVRRRVQMLMMWRLTEVLALTPEQGARFFPVFNTYQAKIRGAQKRLQLANNQLRAESTKAHADDMRLAQLVREVVDAQGQLNLLRTNQLKATIRVLTPQQQAKMLLFLPRFNKLIRQLVHGQHRLERRRKRTPKP